MPLDYYDLVEKDHNVSVFKKNVLVEQFVSFKQIGDTKEIVRKAEQDLLNKNYANPLPYRVFWCVAGATVLISAIISVITLTMFFRNPLVVAPLYFLLMCSIMGLPLLSFFLTKKWLKKSGIYDQDLRNRVQVLFQDRRFDFIDLFKLDCVCDGILSTQGLIPVKPVRYDWDQYFYCEPFEVHNKFYRFELCNSDRSDFLIRLSEIVFQEV